MLDIANARELTNVGVGHLPQGLQYLDLSYGILLTDEGVRRLPKNLLSLNICSNRRFTDACAQYLPKNLTELNLSDNQAFTDRVFLELPKTLRTINFRHNLNISRHAVYDFSSSGLEHRNIIHHSLLQLPHPRPDQGHGGREHQTGDRGTEQADGRSGGFGNPQLLSARTVQGQRCSLRGRAGQAQGRQDRSVI